MNHLNSNFSFLGFHDVFDHAKSQIYQQAIKLTAKIPQQFPWKFDSSLLLEKINFYRQNFHSVALYANIPAKINDYLIKAHKEKEAHTDLARWTDNYFGFETRAFCQKVLSRVVGCIVFPIFTEMDLISNIVKMPIEGIKAKKSKSQEVKEEHIRNIDRLFENTKKSLLGILAFPISLVSPDLVTRHFLPNDRRIGVIEAGGKYHSAKGIEKHPKSIDEVESLVLEAIREGKKITLSGAHYSQSKDTLPTTETSLCINMKELNAVKINEEKKTATIQAGATWRDVQEAANHSGLAVKVMQASNVFSLGGSLSVNCHGWDHRTGTLAETVRSLKIIDAEGKIQTLTPEDELFKLVIGGHGLFGVILEAEIELTDNELLLSWGEKVAPEDYATYFQEKILPNENHVMHLYRLSLDPKAMLKEGVAVTYTKTEETKHSPANTCSKLKDEPQNGTRLDRIMMHIARCIAYSRAVYWKLESQKITKETKVTRNEVMRPPINGAFNHSRADAEWLQEYFVKPKELSNFLEKLGKVLMDNKVPVFNASVRFVKKDDSTALPYASGGDHFAIVLFFNQSLAKEKIEETKKWVREVIDYLIEHDGTYYLPYQQFATSEQFSSCYPQADYIRSMKEKYDHHQTFDNGLYADYLAKK